METPAKEEKPIIDIVDARFISAFSYPPTSSRAKCRLPGPPVEHCTSSKDNRRRSVNQGWLWCWRAATHCETRRHWHCFLRLLFVFFDYVTLGVLLFMFFGWYFTWKLSYLRHLVQISPCTYSLHSSHVLVNNLVGVLCLDGTYFQYPHLLAAIDSKTKQPFLEKLCYATFRLIYFGVFLTACAKARNSISIGARVLRAEVLSLGSVANQS